MEKSLQMQKGMLSFFSANLLAWIKKTFLVLMLISLLPWLFLVSGCSNDEVVNAIKEQTNTLKEQTAKQREQLKQETTTTVQDIKKQATDLVEKVKIPVKHSGEKPKNSTLTGIACLRSKGLTLYGSLETCIFTKQQKEKLGDAFNEFQYVDCQTHIEVCQQEGVTRMPLWKTADGKSVQSVLSLEGLIKNFDCE